jgi:hypothetical protein
MLVVESFLRSLVKVYGTHTAVYSDCGGTWYHEAHSSLFLSIDCTHVQRKARLKESDSVFQRQDREF